MAFSPTRSQLPTRLRGFVRIHGRRLETAAIVPTDVRPDAPHLVFLHDAFGSVSAWTTFPSEVARATRCPVFVYSRAGHGHSDAAGPVSADYLQVEAQSILPALLDSQGIVRPVLVGHEDGAGIALVHASDFDVAGVIAIAARVAVDEPALSAVLAALTRFAAGATMPAFTRHHRDPAALLARYAAAWSLPPRAALLASSLARIVAPVLVVHGEDDEHATLTDVAAIAQGLGSRAQTLSLPAAGHAPWEDAPRAVLAAMVAFVDTIVGLQRRPLSASARA